MRAVSLHTGMRQSQNSISDSTIPEAEGGQEGGRRHGGGGGGRRVSHVWFRSLSQKVLVVSSDPLPDIAGASYTDREMRGGTLDVT